MVRGGTEWRSRSAWTGLVAPGRHGRVGGDPGVCVMPREGLGLALIVGRDLNTMSLGVALSELVGAAPPAKPRVTSGDNVDLIWAGPRRWLLVSGRRDIVQIAQRKLGGLAAVTDQTDARAILRLSGPRARDALAKGCLIDLHPRVFAPGDTALTTIAHIGVQLWQVDDVPTFDLTVSRSLAASFWSWLAAAAAEYACEIVTPRERGTTVMAE